MEDFEEQALTSAPCMPKIWKRYVDDTFTILSCDKVDLFLQQLNSSTTDYPFHYGNWDHLFILLLNQSTPSPDEDQQHSGQNVAIHIQVTQSWDKWLTQLSVYHVLVEL